MKLSDFQGIKKESIYNEKEFQTLGLINSSPNLKMCTFLEDEKYLNNINENVTMLITTEKVAKKVNNPNIGIYIDENPRITFFKLHNELNNNKLYEREKFVTRIGKNCNISDLAVISENNVIIEDNVKIEEFVIIRENTIIKENSIIRAGNIIGGEGFEFKKENNEIFHVKHLGGVIIDKNVEIQYNTTIDKAIYPWDNTMIGEYSKIGNLNHIAHGTKIGKCALIVGNSLIAGRVTIGNNAWIGMGSIIRNGLVIGNNTRCNMGAIVTKNVNDNESVTGNFAIPHDKFIMELKKIIDEEE